MTDPVTNLARGTPRPVALQRGRGDRSGSTALSGGDEALVSRVRAGDTEAFQKLFHSYYRPLCIFAASLIGSADSAEDIVQELLCRIWDQRADWYVQSSLRTYLFRAARNRALGFIKHDRVVNGFKIRVHIGAGEDAALQVPGMAQPETPVDERLVAVDVADAARRCVEGLPSRCREAIALRRDGGLSYAEIADTMGVSVKRVEALLTEAYKALRAVLAAHR